MSKEYGAEPLLLRAADSAICRWLHPGLYLAAALLILLAPPWTQATAVLRLPLLAVLVWLYLRDRKRLARQLRLELSSGKCWLDGPDGPQPCHMSQWVANRWLVALLLSPADGREPRARWMLLFADAFAPGDFRQVRLLLQDLLDQDHPDPAN